jgi:hypothetical protein
MYTLDTVNVNIAYSANGNIKLTQTVVNAIASLGKVRNTMTADDVTYIINRKAHRDEQVTVKQVEAAIKPVVAATLRSERYNGMRKGLVNIGSGFYEYK